jgi:hypothetical protein
VKVRRKMQRGRPNKMSHDTITKRGNGKGQL